MLTVCHWDEEVAKFPQKLGEMHANDDKHEQRKGEERLGDTFGVWTSNEFKEAIEKKGRGTGFVSSGLDLTWQKSTSELQP